MILSLLSAYVFANFISPENYGTYKYILSVLGLFGIFTLVGMDTAVVEGVAKNETGTFRSALIEKIKWGLLGSLCSIFIGVYYYTQGNSVLGLTFLLTSLLIPFIKSITLWQSFLVGKKLFKHNSIYTLIVQSLIISCTTLVLFLTRDIYYTLATFLCTQIIAHAIAHLVLSKIYNDFTEKGFPQKVLSFGKKLSFSKSFSVATEQADNLILWHFLGPIAVAHFMFAKSINAIPQKLIKSIINIFYPKLVNQKTNKLWESLPKKTIRATLILIAPVSIYILIIPVVFNNLFPQYVESIKYAQVLAISLIISPSRIYGKVLTSRDVKRPTYNILIFSPILRLLSLIILVPILGVWGVICSIMITNFTASSFVLFYLKKLSDADIRKLNIK